MDIASGFGGGMGRLQETCGAISASFMVIGIQNSKTYADEEIRKEKTINRIQDFADKFKSIHETTNCANLLNCDLNTKEGRELVKQNSLDKSVCERRIVDSIKIIEESKE